MPDYYKIVKEGLNRDSCPQSPPGFKTWRRRYKNNPNRLQTINAVAFAHDDCLKINICPNCIDKCIDEINALPNARAHRDTNFQGDPENRVVIVLYSDPSDPLKAVINRWLSRGRNEANDCKC